MPFVIPTLASLRQFSRDFTTSRLPGSEAAPPNSRLRVLSDMVASATYLVLLYMVWLSKQLMVDTAEAEWLDRHAAIWVGGRLAASYAAGTVNVTGTDGTVLPLGTRMVGAGGAEYETTAAITVGTGATPVAVSAITPGVAGNQEVGASLSISSGPVGVDSGAVVVFMGGGVDAESDDSIRARTLFRIRRPPMGGDADDYVAWSRAVPGVTRAWAAPNAMGIGTITVFFMMDDLRATSNPMTDGFPTPPDVAAVTAALDLERPVAIKDFFVEAPIPEPIDFTVVNLVPDTPAIRAALEASVKAMIRDRAAPGHSLNGVLQPAETIHQEWVSGAILNTPGVISFSLSMTDHVMPTVASLAVIGTVAYA